MSDSRNNSFFPVLLLLLIGLLYYIAYVGAGIVMNDEGILTSGALRLADGMDRFTESPRLYPPGRFLYARMLFRLFGEQLIVLKFGWIFLRLVTAVTLYLAGSRLAPRRYAFSAALFTILVPGHWHKTFFQLFPAVGLLLSLKYLQDGEKKWTLAAAGAWAGIAFFFRQDTALFSLMAGGAALIAAPLWKREKPPGSILRVFTGLAWLLLPFALVFAVEASFFPAVWPDWIMRPLRVMARPGERLAIPLPGILPSAPGSAVEALFTYIPFLLAASGILLAATRIFTGRPSFLKPGFLPLAVIVLCSLNQVWWMSNYAHLLQALPPVYLLGACLVHLGSRTRLKPIGRVVQGTTAALAALFLCYNLIFCTDPGSGTIRTGRIMTERLISPAAEGIRHLPEKTEAVNRVTHFLSSRTTPGEPVFVFPQLSLLYMLAERPNPTRFDYFEFVSAGHDIAIKDVDREILADIDSSGTRYIVYSEPATFLGTPRTLKLRFSVYNRDLFHGLMQRFRPVVREGGFVILEREPQGCSWAADYCLGVDAWKRNDWEEADSSFTAALAEGADLADVHLLSGDAAYRQEDYGAALKRYSIFLDRSEGDGDLCFRMGNIYAALERWDEAADWYRKAAAASGGDSRRILKLATALKQAGRFGEALRLADLIDPEPGEVEELLLLRGSILFKRGRFSEARELLTLYRNKGGRDPAGLALLASVHLSEGKAEETFEIHASLIEVDPEDPFVKTRAAAALRMAGRFEESTALLESLTGSDGKPADFWLHLALSYFEAGSTGKAEKAIRRHLKAFPEDLEAQIHQARIVSAAGGIPELDRISPRARLGDISPAGGLLLARFHLERNDPGQASGLLNHFLDSGLFAEDPLLLDDALDLLGSSLFRERKYRAGRDATLSLLARNPRRESALLRMAAIAAKSKDSETESVFLEKALDASPSSENVHLALISFAQRSSGRKTALEKAEKARAALPESRAVALAFGRVALEADEFDKTRKALAFLSFEFPPKEEFETPREPPREDGEALLLAADLAMAEGRFGEARRFFSRHQHFFPEIRKGWTGLAEAALRDGDPVYAAGFLAGKLTEGGPASFDECTLMARALLASGREAEATAYLYLAARKAPHDPSLLSALGDRFLEVGMPGEALRSYRKAGTSGNVRAALGEADALRVSGQAGQAAAHYSGVVEHFPGSWQAAAAKGELMLERGDVDEAADLFTQACLEAGSGDAATVRLARSLMRCGKPGPAVEVLTARSRMRPGSEKVFLALAKVLEAAGKAAKAVEILGDFTDRNRSVRGLLLLSAMALENDRPAMAKEAAAEAAGAGAEITDNRLASFVADRRIAAGDREGAGKIISDLISSGQADPAFLTWYAAYLADSGNPDEAVPLLEKALTAGSNDEAAALLIIKNADEAEALRILARHLLDYPDKTEIRRILGELLVETGETDLGLAHLRRAYEEGGEDVSYVLTLARAIHRELGAEQALPYFEEALLDAGNDPDALYDAANAFLDAARPRLALEVLAKAGELAPRNWRIRTAEAKTLEILGEYDRAEAELADALDAVTATGEVQRVRIELLVSRFELEKAIDLWKGMDNRNIDLLLTILDRYPVAVGLNTPPEGLGGLLSDETTIDPERLEALISSLIAAGSPGDAAEFLARYEDRLSPARKSYMGAKIALAEGEPARALARLNFALDLEPGNPDIVLFAVRTFVSWGRIDDALALSRRIIRISPTGEKAALARLTALLAAGNLKGADRLAERTVWSAAGALEASVEFAGAGLFETAAGLYRTAPTGKSHYGLHAAYASQVLAAGRCSEVMELLEKNVSEKPDPLTVMLYSEAALRIHMDGQALPAVKKAADRLSGSISVLAAKAALLAKAGRFDEAAATFRKIAATGGRSLAPELASPAPEISCLLMGGRLDEAGERLAETGDSGDSLRFTGGPALAAGALAARKSVLERVPIPPNRARNGTAGPVRIFPAEARNGTAGSGRIFPAEARNGTAGSGRIFPAGSPDRTAGFERISISTGSGTEPDPGSSSAVLSAWLTVSETVASGKDGDSGPLSISLPDGRFSLLNGGDIALALGDSTLALSLYKAAKAASGENDLLSPCVSWPVSIFDETNSVTRLDIPGPGQIFEAARYNFLPPADLLFSELSLAKGNSEAASSQLERFADQYPLCYTGDADTWYRTAFIHLADGEKEPAVSALDIGLAADQPPSSLASALPLLVSAGQVDRARSLMEKIELQFTLNPTDYIAFARSLVESGEIETAMAVLERGAIVLQGSKEMLLELALVYRVSNQPALARNSLEGALALFPEDQRIRMEMADLYYAAGAPEQAAFLLERLFSEEGFGSPLSWELLEEMVLPERTSNPSRVICNCQTDISRKRSIFLDAVSSAVKNNDPGRAKLRKIRRAASS